jgi:hypothetical protein
MAGEKTGGFWDQIGRGNPKAAIQGLLDIVTDLTPQTSDKTKLPPTGKRRTAAATALDPVDAAKNVALNLVDPRQWYRTFKNTVTGIPSLLSGEVGTSMAQAYVGQQIAERRAKKQDVSPNWYRNNILLPRERRKFSDKQINDLMQTSTAKWNVLSNNFSYVDPKTNQRVVDWNSIGHRLVENPADVVLMFTGIGEVGAAGNLARLTKAGRIGPGADVLSNAGNLSRTIQTGSRLGSIAADPLTALAVGTGTKALVRGADIVQRTRANPVTSILDPNYVTAFEKYKADTLDNLIQNQGMSQKQARQWINQNKDNMFYDFNAQNGGQFSNPYNRETTAMFTAQGKDPTAYGAPSIYTRVNQNFNRSGGPSAPALRQVTLEAGQVANPRRSSTTFQAAPPLLARNEQNWIAQQQANLRGQLDDRLSSNYPGQQFDFGALTSPTDPIPGSTLGDFVYRPDGGWHSMSGNRVGPSLQPALTDQFRIQNPIPNISPADLAFVRRNRAANSDLGQAYDVIPPAQSVLERAYGTAKSLGRPIGAAAGMFYMSGSPQLAAATGVATAGGDIVRGVKAGKSYLDEISGNPFLYDPNNPFLKNQYLLPRTFMQGSSAVIPNPIQVEPAKQQPKPAAVAPAPAAVENREAIVMPELKQENTTPAPIQAQELTPEKYDLSEYGITPKEELKPEVFDLSEYGRPRKQGGRIAYKKGGAVHSNVEPLVQELMKRYKAVKKSQDNGTKPLLEQPDQAIVKALEVAQKAI